MGCFITPFKNVDAQLQECKRANFFSRANVKLMELPVALGELWEEGITPDYSSTINPYLG